MGVEGGAGIKKFRKKDSFVVLSGKNKFHHFWTPRKNVWKIPLVPPLDKILPTLMHVSM